MTPRERNALSRALTKVAELERWNQRLAAELQATEREREWAVGQLRAIRGLAAQEAPKAPARYANEEDRLEARRATWRESKRRRKAIESAA